MLKGHKHTKKTRQKMRKTRIRIGIPSWNKGKKLGFCSEKRCKFIKEQRLQICKQYIEDKLNTYELAKKYNCSVNAIRYVILREGYDLRTVSEAQKDKKHFEETKQKIREKAVTPERIQQSIRNGFGKKCYYKNEFFSSLSERDCYIKFIDLGYKVMHNFLGRFDFLVNNKIVVEFHSYDRNGLTNKQYYDQRRKLLNEYEHKDLKLVVIKDLKEIENKLKL